MSKYEKLLSRYLGDNRVADIKVGEYSYIEIEKGQGGPWFDWLDMPPTAEVPERLVSREPLGSCIEPCRRNGSICPYGLLNNQAARQLVAV